MSGLGVEIYTDEDVDKDLATQLRRHSYTTLSCQEAQKHNLGLTDLGQLCFAHGEGRAILVFNKKDYIPLDRVWKSRGEEHHGIILADQLPLSELLRRTRLHLDTVSPERQYNTVLYLSLGR